MFEYINDNITVIRDNILSSNLTPSKVRFSVVKGPLIAANLFDLYFNHFSGRKRVEVNTVLYMYIVHCTTK